jgi:hypothetical protein
MRRSKILRQGLRPDVDVDEEVDLERLVLSAAREMKLMPRD